MKLIRNIILSFILMFTMTSCEDWFYIDHISKPVEFGITTGKSIKTRTSYTGDINNNNSKERLEWIDGDDVRIWMYWDEDRDGLYESGYELADYKVINNRPSNEKSYGRLSPKGSTSLRWKGDFTGENGRAREYLHKFYSIYPADGGKDFDGTNITFNIPSSQKGVNMKLAYMTAYKDNVTSLRDDNNPDKYVELPYYPRVTTLYIVVVNDTDETINSGEIKLTSSDSPIAGDYTVSFNNLSGESDTGGGNEITNSIKTLNKGDFDTVAFFIRPRQYASNELSLTFNGKTQPLNKDFEPNYKYNINITVSKEEPEVDGPFSSFVNGVILAEAHKQGSPFYHGDWQWGEVDGVKKIFGTNTSNNNAWEPVPDELLWEIINGIVDLDVKGTWEMGDTITPEDLNIFPNLQTVKLSGYYKKVEINNPQITEIDITTSEGDGVFNIHDCTSLEKLNIHEGKSVTVKGNGNLTELSVNSQNISDFELDDCDALTTFVVDASPNGNCVKNVKVSNNKSLIDFYIKQPTTNDNFYLLAENNESLTHFEIQQVDWQGIPDWNAWGLTYRFDIKNCPSFKDYKVSNNAKTW